MYRPDQVDAARTTLEVDCGLRVIGTFGNQGESRFRIEGVAFDLNVGQLMAEAKRRVEAMPDPKPWNARIFLSHLNS